MRAGAQMRQAMFGRDQAGETQLARLDESPPDFECYFTPVRTQQQLDESGFKDVHDTIVRFSKLATVTPEIGKKLRLLNAAPSGDLLLRIEEFGSSPTSPEYVLGCKALF
jgi:hypothetical protein